MATWPLKHLTEAEQKVHRCQIADVLKDGTVSDSGQIGGPLHFFYVHITQTTLNISPTSEVFPFLTNSVSNLKAKNM